MRDREFILRLFAIGFVFVFITLTVFWELEFRSERYDSYRACVSRHTPSSCRKAIEKVEDFHPRDW